MSSQPKFLYVEDDPFSREIMQMLLNGLGYTDLTMFEDSTDFQRRIEGLSFTPDIVFLDVQVLPHDGFDMLRMLRKCPTIGGKTVIALTASVMNEEIARLKQEGFDGAIAKPLDFDNFASLIQQALQGEKVWYVS